MTGQKKLYVKTFGCQMNVYDSERMSEALANAGYVAADDVGDADLVVLNTCHIREKAAEKVYSELGRLNQLKRQRAAEGRETLLAVTGCVAQAEGHEIVARAPQVDLVVGPQSYHRLPDLVRRAALGHPVVDTEFPEEDKFAHLPERTLTAAPAASPAAAFLTVQEGCDKFCTFCVVPYTRGMEMSRPVAMIEAEARRLVDRGVREITLLGQNVNGYHGEGPDGGSWSLARLMARLATVDGLERLRYTTSHPRDMSDDLIDAHRDNAKLMPYLHLPFQAGSDRILAAMNRRYTASSYLALVDRVRARMPDVSLSTDILVGFPGETEEDLEATLTVMRKVGYSYSFMYHFNPREGTPAARMEGRVPDRVKKARLARVITLQKELTRSRMEERLGSVTEILVESVSRRRRTELLGRTAGDMMVVFPGNPERVGTFARVLLESIQGNTFRAKEVP
jgi:tRNA-2-methylthio-N6-dimethylallyladenosine synthase